LVVLSIPGGARFVVRTLVGVLSVDDLLLRAEAADIGRRPDVSDASCFNRAYSEVETAGHKNRTF
jgi:hypothetical protein